MSLCCQTTEQVKNGNGPFAGLPTFRNCLEGETSSAKRKNPQVGSRPAHGSRGKTLERGPRQRPLV